MHPRLKRVDKDQTSRPSQDLEFAVPETGAAGNPVDLTQAVQKTAVDGAQPPIRKPITAEKFAYLRAQVHVFRRSR